MTYEAIPSFGELNRVHRAFTPTEPEPFHFTSPPPSTARAHLSRTNKIFWTEVYSAHRWGRRFFIAPCLDEVLEVTKEVADLVGLQFDEEARLMRGPQDIQYALGVALGKPITLAELAA